MTFLPGCHRLLLCYYVTTETVLFVVIFGAPVYIYLQHNPVRIFQESQLYAEMINIFVSHELLRQWTSADESDD